VSDVRRRVGVIDRRRDVEGLGHFLDKLMERTVTRNWRSRMATGVPLSDLLGC
jgi:hypothetical protein